MPQDIDRLANLLADLATRPAPEVPAPPHLTQEGAQARVPSGPGAPPRVKASDRDTAFTNFRQWLGSLNAADLSDLARILAKL